MELSGVQPLWAEVYSGKGTGAAAVGGTAGHVRRVVGIESA